MELNNGIKAIFSYTKEQNILINKEDFKYQVETHPDCPSLLAYSDALSFFNIPNKAFKLSFEKIDYLPDSFIAILEREDQQLDLFHITKYGGYYYLYDENNRRIETTKKELKSIWHDVVLLAELPEENSAKNKSKIPDIYILTVVLFFVICSSYFFSQSIFIPIFGLWSMIGLFLSIEALKTELGIESKVSQTFCNAIPNADCGQVINSTKNKWLQKLKISDVSICFFVSQLLALFIFSVAGLSKAFFNYVLVSLALSIPMTFYSIFFQYKIEKKWCPICLSIIGIVYIELVSLIFIKPSIYFNLKTVMLFSLIFIVVVGLVYILKPVFIERKDLKEKYIKLLHFSKNYDVFKNTLLKSETQFFEKEYIVLGNKESVHKISIVTSPLCNFCEDAHYVLDHIFNRFGNDIAISIRFNYDENMDDEIRNLFMQLAKIYEKMGDTAFLEALKYWFENKNIENWSEKYGLPENMYDIEKRLKEITAENLKKGLNFTPNIFLNQYNYPKQYGIENLEYFIADLIEDKDI